MPSEGLFTAAPPSLNDQDLSVLRVDASGNLKVTSAGGGGEAITGPLGASLGAPAAIGVVQQDGQMYTISASSAAPLIGTGTNQTTGAIPTAGYASASIQITTTAVGGIYQFENSNDGITWQPVLGYPSSTAGSVAPGFQASVAAQNTFPLSAAFIRVRASAYTSGTVTAIVVMKVANPGNSAVFATTVPATGALFTVNAGVNNASSLWGSVNNVAAAAGGVALFSRIPSCAATTNLTGVKSTPGRVYKILATNTTAAAIYIKFYNNVSGAVVVGTSTVFMSRTIPANSTASYDFMDIGAFFGVGITYALTTGPLDSDATAVTAGAVVQLEVAFA